MNESNLEGIEIKILQYIGDHRDCDDQKIADALKICDLGKTRKMLRHLEGLGYIGGVKADQGNWVLIFIKPSGENFLRNQSKFSKKDWLEMMQMIEDGQNSVCDLQNHFGDIKYGKVKCFLLDRKYVAKNGVKLTTYPNGEVHFIGSNITSWKLTPNGREYYEAEIEKKEYPSPMTINAFNSNVAYNSSRLTQSIKISHDEFTPQIKKLLLELKKATEVFNQKEIETLMERLRNMSANIFCGVISSGIFQFLAQYSL